jgi:uncharacterized phage protein (TIGR01671 family)
MRELKFRAWNGVNLIDRSLFDRNWYYKDKLVSVAHPNDIRNLKVMQYTGLKDKNGTEIYEGDILSVPSHYEGDIEYSASCERVRFIEGGFEIDCSINFSDCEVIGNIHENPELLKEKGV